MSASAGGPRHRGLRLVAALVVALVVPLASASAEDFRITHTVDRSGAEHILITGVVFNDARQEVLDVSVTAEALDAKGKVLARGIAYVSGRIPGQSSAPFTAKVPAVASATRFRVSVSSFRAGLGTQAP
jgi:hypothetical protein